MKKKNVHFTAILAVVLVNLSTMWLTGCNADFDEEYFGYYTMSENLLTRSNTETGPGDREDSIPKRDHYYGAGTIDYEWNEVKLNHLIGIKISVSWDEGQFPMRINKTELSLLDPNDSYFDFNYTLNNITRWEGGMQRLYVDARVKLKHKTNNDSCQFDIRQFITTDLTEYEKDF